MLESDIKVGHWYSTYSTHMTDDGVKTIMSIVSDNTNFYTVDIGQLTDGSWIVIELNDGQMAGISGCDMNELYSNLARVLA